MTRDGEEEREAGVDAVERLLLDKAPDLFALGIDVGTIIALLRRPKIVKTAAPINYDDYNRGYTAGAATRDSIVNALKNLLFEFGEE